MDVEKNIELLKDNDNMKAYKALKELLTICENSNQTYLYFDKYVAMINNKSNSYIRTRGLRLIAFNSKWDKENKINSIIAEYLQHFEDESPITSRQCIKDVVIIARNKSELVKTIQKALDKSDRKYEGSMQSLINKDRQTARQQIKKFMS